MPEAGGHIVILVVLGAAVLGYLLLFFCSPCRDVFLHGARVLQRYPVIWKVLVLFGASYVLFRLALDLTLRIVASGAGWEGVRVWDGWQPPMASGVLMHAALGVAEDLGGVFNVSVPTFPLSSLVALAFLFNVRGLQRELWSALERHAPLLRWVLHPLLLVLAVAAVLEPVLYVALPLVSRGADATRLLFVSAGVDLLAFLFETLAGTVIQVFIMATVLVWIRGMRVERGRVLEFTIHRMGYVIKWAMVVMLATVLLIHLPLLTPYFPGSPFGLGEAVGYVDTVGRWLIAVFLLLFCSVQITLVFHNDGLSEALRAHFRFVHRNAAQLGWFLAVSASTLLVMELGNAWLLDGLGAQTVAGKGWMLAFVFVKFPVAAWLLVSWVCLFKKVESGFTRLENYIKF